MGRSRAEVYDADLVAISTFSAQVFEAYAIADRLRAAGVKVAMGGLHVSVCAEEAAQHADYVIVGEGENVWPSVVRAAEDDMPARMFDSIDFPPVDAAALPVPRYDLLEDRPYNRFTVQTSRGCPWRCDFLRIERDAGPEISQAAGGGCGARHPGDASDTPSSVHRIRR